MEPVDRADATDEQLALECKHGDVRAFEELVHRYQGRVYAVAYHVTLNREDALDVAQEVFLSAYRKIHRWQPTGGFLHWLLRMATNRAIDQVRQRKRYRRRLADSAVEAKLETGPGPAVPPNPERHAEARETGAHIQQALEVLSPAQRAVFAMRHYEGLQLNEIARTLGCSVGSVKVHLFRALRKLQKELEGFHDARDR